MLSTDWIRNGYLDTRILLSLTGSECFWRRWKTTHNSLHWAMEAGDSPWLLLQNAEETTHSKCTFWRTWFLFPCDCWHSLMLSFIFCWSFLRILNLVFNIQCHCNPPTWLCLARQISVSQKSKTTSKLFFPSVSKTLINVKFPLILKAGIKHCNDLRAKFVRSKSKEQCWRKQTTRTCSRKTAQLMAKRAAEHRCNPAKWTFFFYSQSPQIYNRVQTTLEETICHQCMVDSPWTENTKRQKYVYDPQDV